MTWLKMPLIYILLLQISCVNTGKLSLYRPEIDMSTPGIIGNFKFYTKPDNQIQALYDSTSAIVIYDDLTGKVIGMGTAVLVKNTQDNSYYLLTAAHNIFDFSKARLRGHKISFGYTEDKYSYDFFSLAPLKRKYITYNSANDFIAIPVKKAKHRPALLIDFANPFPKGTYNKKLDSRRLIAVSVKFTGNKRGFIKFHQTNFKLFPNERFLNRMKSDLDVIHGMSGSPVFYLDASNNGHLLGVVSGSNKHKNCIEFTVSSCFNLIVPIKIK